MKKSYWLFVLLLIAGHVIASAQARVEFSHTGGAYPTSPELLLSCDTVYGSIRYTTNGSMPTPSSPAYTGPLLLDEGMYSHSDIFRFMDCADSLFHEVDSVRHAIVIRAAAFAEDGTMVTPVATNTYMIESLGCTHSLPVLSLCTDSLSLFDADTGLFVPDNYLNTGDEWERLCNVEFFESGGEPEINQQCGLRTHGGMSRKLQQKGLRLYARKEYGKKKFKYRFFEDKDIDGFKRLVLKPFCASHSASGITDYLCTKMVYGLDVEHVASRPVAVYLNGEYWGLYYLQERPDERFIEENVGIDSDSCYVSDGWFGVSQSELYYRYDNLRRFIENSDLTDPDQYAYVSSEMDVSSFIDYYIFQMYVANVDVPSHNVRFWCSYDTPWRWLFYDGDFCLQYMEYESLDSLLHKCETQGFLSRYTVFFRKLHENETFNSRFVERYVEMAESTFDYSRFRGFFESITTEIESEIPNQTERYGYPSSRDVWEEACADVDWFMQNRRARVDEMMSHYGISETNEIVTDMEIIPNPSSNMMVAHFVSDRNGITELAVMDVMGKCRFMQELECRQGDNKVELNVNLSPGVYVIRLGSTSVKHVVM